MTPTDGASIGSRTVRDLYRRGEVDRLVVLVGHPNWRVSRDAASALGALRVVGAVSVIASLLAHRHARVREAATWALGELSVEEAAAALGVFTARLCGPGIDPRELYWQGSALRGALASLGRLSDAGVAPPRAVFEQLREDAERALFVDPRDHRTGWRWRIDRLAQLRNGAALELFLRALADCPVPQESNDAGARRVVDREVERVGVIVLALGALGDARAVEPLLDLIGDERLVLSRTQTSAIHAITQLDPLRGRELLVQLARSGGLSSLSAAEKLADLRNPALHDTLLELLTSRQKRLRTAAAIGLARLGDRTGRELLQQAIDDYRTRRRPDTPPRGWRIHGPARAALTAFPDPLKATQG